jgi:hypothetical protein
MITSAWSALDPEIDAFIEEFDRTSSQANTEATALFAETFLALDPARALALTPTMLAGALHARRGMFAKAGVGAVRRTNARQLRLDDHHVLVAADWTADRADREPLRLESTFLIRREPDGPRIVVYLNHHDVAALLSTGS